MNNINAQTLPASAGSCPEDTPEKCTDANYNHFSFAALTVCRNIPAIGTCPVKNEGAINEGLITLTRSYCALLTCSILATG